MYRTLLSAYHGVDMPLKGEDVYFDFFPGVIKAHELLPAAQAVAHL